MYLIMEVLVDLPTPTVVSPKYYFHCILSKLLHKESFDKFTCTHAQFV